MSADENGMSDAQAVAEYEAARVRIEVIERFPQLAPLMYSIEVQGVQPASVDAWLDVIHKTVHNAITSRCRERGCLTS